MLGVLLLLCSGDRELVIEDPRLGNSMRGQHRYRSVDHRWGPAQVPLVAREIALPAINDVVDEACFAVPVVLTGRLGQRGHEPEILEPLGQSLDLVEMEEVTPGAPAGV